MGRRALLTSAAVVAAGSVVIGCGLQEESLTEPSALAAAGTGSSGSVALLGTQIVLPLPEGWAVTRQEPVLGAAGAGAAPSEPAGTATTSASSAAPDPDVSATTSGGSWALVVSDAASTTLLVSRVLPVTGQTQAVLLAQSLLGAELDGFRPGPTTALAAPTAQAGTSSSSAPASAAVPSAVSSVATMPAATASSGGGPGGGRLLRMVFSHAASRTSEGQVPAAGAASAWLVAAASGYVLVALLVDAPQAAAAIGTALSEAVQ